MEEIISSVASCIDVRPLQDLRNLSDYPASEILWFTVFYSPPFIFDLQLRLWV